MTRLEAVKIEPFGHDQPVHARRADEFSSVTICGASRGNDDPAAFRRMRAPVTCPDCQNLMRTFYKDAVNELLHPEVMA